MEVVLWDRGNISDLEDYSKLTSIGEVDLEHIDVGFGGFIIIDGRSFKICNYLKREDVLVVNPICLDRYPDDVWDSDNFFCPYCFADLNSYRDWDIGTLTCESCGSKMEYAREVRVSYNIYPIKCAPIIETITTSTEG